MNTGLSKPEQIVFEIMDKLAEHIGQKINQNNCYLHLSINPAYLKRTPDGRLDKKSSIDYFSEESDKLAISELAGYCGEIFLEIAWLSAFFDYAVRKNNPNYDGFREITESYPKKWLLQQKSEVIKNSPFTFIAGGKSDFLKVVVETTGDMSMSLTEFRIDAFVKQLKRKIQYKNDLDQFDHDNPNILIVSGTNSEWKIHGHTEILTDFTKVRKKVSKFLSDHNFKHLSGIIWFNTNLENAKIILNPNVSKKSKLEPKLLAKLEFDIHDDRKFL